MHAKVQSGRLDLVRAVLLHLKDGSDEAFALKTLGAPAMGERTAIEDASRSVIAGWTGPWRSAG